MESAKEWRTRCPNPSGIDSIISGGVVTTIHSKAGGFFRKKTFPKMFATTPGIERGLDGRSVSGIAGNTLPG
jgi:hypothetical protein